MGEKLAGINPDNKTKISIGGRTRVPDAYVKGKYLREVKNVKYISNTAQLRDYANFAKANKIPYELFVRPDTVISQSVIDAGWTIKYLW